MCSKMPLYNNKENYFACFKLKNALSAVSGTLNDIESESASERHNYKMQELSIMSDNIINILF